MIRRVADRSLLVPFLTALAFAVVVGCGGEEAKQTPAPEAAKPQAREQQAPSNPPKSLREELSRTIDRPDDYPSDAPVYPGSSTSHVQTYPDSMNVTFSTSDDPGRVASYMERELGGQGWDQIRVESMPNSAGSITYGFKADRKIAVMAAQVDSGGADPLTMIMVRVER